MTQSAKTDSPGKRGASKGDWLEAALNVLSNGSVADIKIDSLAKKLGISRSGFYWHFKNRRELLDALLGHWVHEVTEIISQNTKLASLEPKKRLRLTAELILDHDLVQYEIGVRQWALQDPAAARVVRKVNAERMKFISGAIEELGFSGQDLEMRAMLFVCYHTWESPMFREISRARRRALIQRRLELITGHPGP